MASIAPLPAQTVDPRGVYRVFLTAGQALPSYGEPTSLGGRIAFVLVIGDPRGKSELQLISLPASAVDVRRTERYTEFLRAQQYAVTGGPAAYSELAAGMNVTLAEIDKQPDPRRRLELAIEARRRIADWPAAHRFYRVNDVRTMLRGFDTIIADLARSSGSVTPPSPIIAEPPRYEPEIPLPGAKEWVELSLAAAAATGDGDTRATILRNALSVAGTSESAAQIRAELARVTGQAPAPAPPASAPAPATPTPAPAKGSVERAVPPVVVAAPPAVKASPPLAKPAPPKADPAATVAPPKPDPVKAEPPAKAKIDAPKVESSKAAPAPAAPAAPAVQAPVPPVPAGSTPTDAPVAAAPQSPSSPRSALAAVAIGVAVLAAAALAFRILRRRPTGQVVAPAAVPVAESMASQSAPVSAPAPAPVPAREPLPLPVPVRVREGMQGLELVTVREAVQHGYHAIEGEVKNVSNRVLENLEVAVRWYVAQGALLATEEAVIDAAGLAAGRSVPFKVLTRSSPGMATYSLLFTSKGDVVAQFQKPGRP